VIVTVTPAPAIDWTVAVDNLEVGGVNRGQTIAREPSGKGVNVTVALNRSGVDSLAVVPVGGSTGDLFRTLAADEGFSLHAVDIDADLRINVTVRDDSGRDTKVNLPGAAMTSDEVEAMVAAVQRTLSGAHTLVIAGSVPEGVSNSLYPRLVQLGNEAGVRVALDTSGPAFTEGLAAQPTLIKPNHHELGDEVGRRMVTLGDVVEACQELRSRGIPQVLASLGASGAYYQDDNHSLYGFVTGVKPVNSVGAGDALLAGFIADPTDQRASLERALVWGASAVQSPTTFFTVDHDLFAGVTVSEDFDPQRPLTD
jgi:1-phosphofructokinase